MAITNADLTEATLTGTGTFDVLMAAARVHLDKEFSLNRIKGPEYATVYLGSLTQVLQTAATFLLNRDKAALEALLVQAQIDLAAAQKDKVLAEIALAEQELLLLQEQTSKVVAEVALLGSQKNLVDQQVLNAVKEGSLLDKQILLADEQISKTAQEVLLLAQKVLTEKAQIQATGVDTDSIIGRQKNLYLAQTDGFARNAEQQAAKILIDTWNVRRTTDEATIAGNLNLLKDATIGDTVSKLLAGIGVTATPSPDV